MSDERDESPYILADYVGIPGEAMTRFLGALKMTGRVIVRQEVLAGKEKLERDYALLKAVFDRATEVLGDDQCLQYVTSGNAVPVTRCTISADLLRRLVEGKQNPVSGGQDLKTASEPNGQS